MLKIMKLKVGQMRSNCYLLMSPDTLETVILDPGDDADFIIRKISDENLKPKTVVATHGHFDHILAVFELKSAFNIPFMMSKKDQFLLDRVGNTSKYFLRINSVITPKIDNNLKDGNVISLSKYKFEIIETPGHTPGSISLYEKGEKIVFVGDLVFANGIFGRTDHGYSDFNKLKKSVCRLKSLPKNVKVFCGHGEETLVSKIKVPG